MFLNAVFMLYPDLRTLLPSNPECWISCPSVLRAGIKQHVRLGVFKGLSWKWFHSLATFCYISLFFYQYAWIAVFFPSLNTTMAHKIPQGRMNFMSVVRCRSGFLLDDTFLYRSDKVWQQTPKAPHAPSPRHWSRAKNRFQGCRTSTAHFQWQRENRYCFGQTLELGHRTMASVRNTIGVGMISQVKKPELIMCSCWSCNPHMPL